MNSTKKQIQNKVLELMKTQTIDSIKVKTIVDSLKISRSTFYLYYDSVFSVLQDIEDTFFDELQDIAILFWSFPPNKCYFTQPHPVIHKALTHLYNHQEISSVLWGPYGDKVFQLRCKKMIMQSFYPSHIFAPSCSEEEYFIISFMVGGHLEMINRWLSEGCIYPIEDLVLLTYRLMFGNYTLQ
ncbi:MAG: TetR/AcrR family transcriptional regulator [Thermoanaerobacteraceae bacterium]|uniref:TetR/AcrR family transcriptional regulator n=1 Tax=Herbinix luporum TaxID=1679721 RepID=UPI0017558931|nr:TetR/AcrR family transcriptional regulator [Herbinix luporum]NLZ52215.1 TetR/AcrR family transcriptional regulator [Thermoanaerobacteraceae bacterium]HHT55978.1 TetR/AcrR family transcriptional regulator [Herbinix luporum]